MPRTAVARALRKARRSGCRPCRRQVGKATQPLGVVAGSFDGLAQGRKRAQAGSGTAAEVRSMKERETTTAESLAKLHCKMTGATPAQSKPVPRVRPTDAQQSAGLRKRLPPWDTVCIRNNRHESTDVLYDGMRRRQASRAKSGVWGVPILPFAGTLRARAACRSKRPSP